MYEVFVDNKKILFIDSTQNFNNTICTMKSSSFLDFKNYHDLLVRLPSSDLIAVVCAQKEKVWRKFVENFQFIDAAGGIVTFNNSFLAIYRNDKWDLPKGKLEKKEQPVIGAEREIEEECGVSELEYINPICNTFHTYLFKDRPVLKKTYWYHFKTKNKQNLRPQHDEGITQAIWMQINRKQDFLNNTYASIIKVLNCFEKSES